MQMPLRAYAALTLATTLWAQAPSPPASPSPDPLLDSLLQEALEHNPDLAQAARLVAADKERIPQARALPDPTLTLGIQNDGFQKIQVGTAETSYYQAMLTQPFYWPGKRDLKADVAKLGAAVSEAGLDRNRLTLRAEVKRAYYGLLLVRDQERLLNLQTPLLEQAEAIAKTRYEVGQGAQMDLLRAQLARTRLAQTRISLDAEERVAVANLNRLRAQPPEAPIPTTLTISQLADPRPIQDGNPALDALEASPEVKAAQTAVAQAERSLDLARLNRKPDFTVSAGIMPRGSLDPMWTFSVGISLPLWSRNKQQRAVAEQEMRRDAQGSQAESLGHLLKARVHERAVQLDSALAMLRLYREGLLVQSEGAFKASLAQYQTGKIPFLSALEALNAWIADQSGFLQTQAQAQSIAIAQEELTLGPVTPIGATGLSAASIGGGTSSPASGAVKPAPGMGSSSDSGSSTNAM
jgi:outer membrane protein, heavy metal efflux system